MRDRSKRGVVGVTTQCYTEANHPSLHFVTTPSRMGKKKGQRGVTTKCYTEDTHPSPHFVTVAPSLVHIRSIRASSHPHTPTRMQHDRATAADGPCHQKVPRPEVRARHVRLGSSRAQRTVPVHQHGRRVSPVPDLLMDQGCQGSFATLVDVGLPPTSHPRPL